MKGKIKLIIFDGYGVVLSKGYPDTVEFLHKKFSIPKQRLFDILYTKYFNQAALGKISQPKAWQLAVKELDLPLTWRQLHDLHIGLLKINRPAYRLAKSLTKKYRVVVLSKNTRMQMTATKKRFPQLARDFAVINTSDLGLPKASPATIRYLLKKFKVKPHEVVFVDDQKANLQAARELGVLTFFYTSFPKFEKFLETVQL